MASSLPFWGYCTDALLAIGQGNYARAQLKLKCALVVVEKDNVPQEYIAARLEYLKKLQNYINSQAQINVSDIKEKLRLVPELRMTSFISPPFPGGLPSTELVKQKEEFGIIIFGHTRITSLGAILESLKRQDALRYTEVWLDGDQGNGKLKSCIDKTVKIVEKYPVKRLKTQRGHFGFRKMLILGLISMSQRYQDILILEDDCFPTSVAVKVFRRELESIRNNKSIFSVYGHHFLVEKERETCTRFQGWGWATTSAKLLPLLQELSVCYSMDEEEYLEFVRLVYTEEVQERMEVTPLRQPSKTLSLFFAWDETLGLLAALKGLVHLKTPERVIYNCGMGAEGAHFPNDEVFRKPPFNMITPEEVWDVY